MLIARKSLEEAAKKVIFLVVGPLRGGGERGIKAGPLIKKNIFEAR